MTNRKPAAVSMDPQMHEDAKARAQRLGFPTFSAYICQLIRKDLAASGALTIEETPERPVITAPRKEVTYKSPARKDEGT